MSLDYLFLKLRATLVRLVVTLVGRAGPLITGTQPDWRIAYPRRTREYSIPSSKTPGTKITIRVWDPPGVDANQVRPVHINFHGSGFVIPFLGQDSDYCELLAARLGITVLDCDYLKAPEYPFPNAYNQVLDVVYHVLAQPALYDSNKVTLGGFSAGAALSLCVAANESLVQEHVKAIVALYPPGDLSNPPGLPPPGPPGSTGLVLTPGIIDLFNRAYGYGGSNLADPRISPIKADYSNFHGKAIIITGEYDNLGPHGQEVAEKMKQQGVEVSHYMIQDVGHAWDKTARPGTWEYDKKAQAYDYVLEFLRGVYQ